MRPISALLVAMLLCVFFPAGLAAETTPCRTSFELYDLNDKLFSLERVLADPATKLVVVDFFSMSCAPCKRAMPRLAELQTSYSGAGLRVVVVAIPAGNDRSSELERVKAFFEPLSSSFPVVFDKYSVVARQYAVTNGGDAHLPQSFVVSKDGRIRNHFEDMDSVIAAIEAAFGAGAKQP